MLVPALGFVLSATFFALIGAALLPRAGVRPVRAWVLGAFVAAAQLGVIGFAWTYGAILADAKGQLGSTGIIYGLLVGMPVTGVFCGWVVARWLAPRSGERV